MSTPTPVDVTPSFPPRTRPGGPAAPATTKPGSALAVLGTRNGQIGAAVAAVLGFALYRRLKNKGNDPASSDTTTTAGGTAGGTADTSATDLYNTLEPLIEKASGFTDAASIEAQLAAIQKALGPGTTTGGTTPPGGKGTTPPPKTTPPPAKGPLFPNQTRQVGKVGTTVDLKSYIAQIFPKATQAQRNQILYATVVDPANKRYNLGSGKIPGGAKVEFFSQAVK